jgi:DnaJ-class molecular chaperone
MIRSDPYQLLGVPRCANDTEVASAHAHLATVFDPRRWEASPPLWEEARVWTRALNEARETILSDHQRISDHRRPRG